VVNSRPAGVDVFVAVQRLVHRYADAVVHRDADQWGSCWAPDAEWELVPGRKVAGAEAIVALWRSAMAGMAAVVQTVDNGDAWHDSAADDTASGRWYITETFRRADGESGVLRAHYDDAYVCRGGRWLFSNRLLRVHYVGPPDLSAPFHNTAEQLAGLRERSN
jgi:ketosteroid isomerase-like protein